MSFGDQMISLKKVIRDESGATDIEYGLIAAGISVVIITIVGGVGTTCRRPSRRFRTL